MVGIQLNHSSLGPHSGGASVKINGPIHPETLQALRGVLDRILDVFKLFGFEHGDYSIDSTLDFWCGLSMGYNVSWLALAKYKTAAFFAAHMSESGWLSRPGVLAEELGFKAMPPAVLPADSGDHPGVLLGGRAYRWLEKKFLRTETPERVVQFLMSILLVKKACPRPDEHMLKQAMWDSLDLLSNDNPLGDKRVLGTSKIVSMIADTYGVFDLSKASPQQLRDIDIEISETPFARAKTVFKDVRSTVPVEKAGVTIFKEKVESVSRKIIRDAKHFTLHGLTSADFKLQIERTVDELFQGKKFVPSKEYSSPWFPSTSANYNRGRGDQGAVAEVAELFEGTGLTSKFKRVELESEQISNDVPVYQIPRESVLTARGVEFNAALDEPAFAEQVALAEALKVRVISKGPPLTYDFLRPFQKFMWSTLNEHPAFLIGGPENEGVVLSRIGKKKSNVLSVDYKSATDLLDPLASEWVGDRIVNNCVNDRGDVGLGGPMHERYGFKDGFRTLVKRALVGHTFVVSYSEYAVKGTRPSVFVSRVLDAARKSDVVFTNLKGEFCNLISRQKFVAAQGLSKLPEEILEELWTSQQAYVDLLEFGMEGDRLMDEILSHSNQDDVPEVLKERLLLLQMKLKFYIKQRWGQLMGSNVSFPVLCILNAAVLRWAAEVDTGRTLSLEEAPIVINGDDGILRTGTVGLAAWQFLSSRIGLKPSVGKVYYSSDYLNINSCGFWYGSEHEVAVLHRDQKEMVRFFKSRLEGDEVHERIMGYLKNDPDLFPRKQSENLFGELFRERPLYLVDNLYEPDNPLPADNVYARGKVYTYRQSNWTMVRAFNLGLAFGMKRSAVSKNAGARPSVQEDYGDKYSSIGCRARDMLAGHSRDDQERLLRYFLKVNRDQLEGNDGYTKVRVPWFIPEEYGGLGLPCVLKSGRQWHGATVNDFVYGPDVTDLKKLNGFITDPRPQQRPRHLPAMALWEVHKLVTPTLPVGEVVEARACDLASLGGSLYNRLYVATACDLVLRSKFSPFPSGKARKKWVDEHRDQVLEVLRNNERFWKRLVTKKRAYPTGFVTNVLGPRRTLFVDRHEMVLLRE